MGKRLILLLLLCVLCVFANTPITAQADAPRIFDLPLAFGEATPPTPNDSGAGNSNAGADANGSGTDNNAAGANSGGNGADNSNTNAGSNSSAADNGSTGTGANGFASNSGGAVEQGKSGQQGGEIINQLMPGAYAPELNQNQKTIEEAAQQYGGPRLASLSLDAAALIPIFSSETFSYAAYVAEGTANVLIMAQAASGSVYIDGVAGNSRRVTLTSAEQNVRVTVTEQSKSTTYTILVLRTPSLEQPLTPSAGMAYITRIQLSNEDVFYEREISPADGTELTLTLPQATSKKMQIAVTVSTDALVYYDNVRVYNGYYYQDSGCWTWSRAYQLASYADNLLGVHLADVQSKAVLNYYSFRIVQPAGLRIQLQVGNEQALVNEALYVLDAPPLIMDAHTVVPLRFIAEALGATVSWQPAEQRVDIVSNGRTLSLFIGEQANGMPLAPFIENGRTMVPLRYVSEQLDCAVEWLAATREIIITR